MRCLLLVAGKHKGKAQRGQGALVCNGRRGGGHIICHATQRMCSCLGARCPACPCLQCVDTGKQALCGVQAVHWASMVTTVHTIRVVG